MARALPDASTDTLEEGVALRESNALAEAEGEALLVASNGERVAGALGLCAAVPEAMAEVEVLGE